MLIKLNFYEWMMFNSLNIILRFGILFSIWRCSSFLRKRLMHSLKILITLTNQTLFVLFVLWGYYHLFGLIDFFNHIFLDIVHFYILLLTSGWPFNILSLFWAIALKMDFTISWNVIRQFKLSYGSFVCCL